MSCEPRDTRTLADRQTRAPSAGASWGGRSRIVLVPLDGSVESKVALSAARLIARPVEASVHVVHVSSQPLPLDDLLGRLRLSPDETHGIVFDQATGTAPNGIVRVAETRRAMLIVMTMRGSSQYEGRVMRPVVERTLRLAPCPVLLVRPEIGETLAGRQQIARILLPLDGAPSTAAVIGPGADIAARSDADVDLLYVATRHPRPLERGTLTTPQYVDQPQHEWPSWAQEFISRFYASYADDRGLPKLHVYLRRGDPAKEILRLAADRHSDIVVLEWRGQLDPRHARVVRGVLANAPCPVLILRTCDRKSQRPTA